jgi:hypothetical protein
MDRSGRVQVSVFRTTAAPAAETFQMLADPANHPALDGSGMLRAARSPDARKIIVQSAAGRDPVPPGSCCLACWPR